MENTTAQFHHCPLPTADCRLLSADCPLPTAHYFHILTLGCKVNQCESEQIAAAIEALGLRRITDGERPDICIVNTCAVTGRAAMQCRQAIRHLSALHPGIRVIVTGCYATTEPDVLSGLPGVVRVIGNDRKADTATVVAEVLALDAAAIRRDASLRTTDTGPLPEAASAAHRTRPFLKIQDGCESFCTYCIVPYARGKSRSVPAEDVLRALSAYEAAGFQEVVLTGIHIGRYGLDLSPRLDIHGLLARILEQRFSLRIRLSSIEPTELTEAIVDLIAQSEGRLCPHVHIPLQSGDDGILRAMNRPYSARHFADVVQRVRSRIPDAAIGSDVLVGFPGETAEAFSNTRSLIESLPLTYLHVFPFSPRPGTAAFQLPNRVDPDIVKGRCSVLRAIGRGKKAAFAATLLGTTTTVLIESKTDPTTGWSLGLSPHYQRVAIEGCFGLPENRLVEVRIVAAEGDRLVGRPVRKPDTI
ncbi:MAG: tRNA (N(6)-L-threonylcarbamoyladenosine(37)-C(2))-methylthiotransferase MtaB [Thermodesulfobacteriota bacterium]